MPPGGIIWLASYPKSGNTWVRAFLANYMVNPDAPLPINELVGYALGDGFLIHYERVSGKKAEALSPQEIARLRPKVHEWFATSKRQTVFVKTHNLIGEVDGSPLITPQVTAGAVYVLRNPLDVAVSYAHHYRVDLDEAAAALGRPNHAAPGGPRVLPQYLGSWSQHVRTWTEAPGLRPLVLRYEDLQEDPEKCFGLLAAFLRWPPEPERLKRAIRFSGFDELAKQEAKGDFRERPAGATSRFFRRGRAGTWREALNDRQVARIVESNRAVMARFGYLAADGTPVR